MFLWVQKGRNSTKNSTKTCPCSEVFEGVF
jgi:hypothetical protein